MQLTLEDVLIAARIVWGEARSDSHAGRKAVAHVLLNRWARDHSLAATALRWLQFSPWEEDDLNRRLMFELTLSSREFRECICAVLEAVDEWDFTQGSTHYHTAAILPGWATGKRPVLRQGHRLFYNNVD